MEFTMNRIKSIKQIVAVIFIFSTAFFSYMYGADSRSLPVTATYCDGSTLSIYPFSFVTRGDGSTFNCYEVTATPIANGYSYGFEDANDYDYNDVIIELWITGNNTSSPMAHIKYVSRDADYKHWLNVVYNGTQQLVFKAEESSPGAVFDIALPTKECPDYEVKAAPPHRTIDAGDDTFYTITVKADKGFSSDVFLSVSGLPAGASASFDKNPLPITGEAKMNITTSESTPPGIYTLTITGTSGDKSHTVDVILEIKAKPPEPDFTIGATPSSREITQGESTSYTVNLTGLNDFNSPVNLSISGLPAGAGGTFTVNPVTPAPNGESVLNISTAVTTPAGTYTLTVTGEGGGKNHSAVVTLKVNEKPAEPDFSIHAAPPNQTITQGEATSYTITITGLNGFNSPVNLSVSGLPAGAGGTFTVNPLTPTPSGESILNIVTTASTPAGTYALTITGKGGGKNHSDYVTLEIKAKPLEPDFTITALPASREIKQGETTSYTITLTGLNGFNLPVNFSVSGLPTGAGGTFSMNPLTPAPTGESVLNIVTTRSVPAGTYSLTITGEGGGKKHSASVSLAVGCRDFSIQINASPEKGLAPLTVQLEAIIAITGEFSAADFQYKWDFNDGASSTEQKPGHTFNTPGAYTVKLIVMDSCGISKTAAKTITVGSVETVLQKTVDKTSAKPGDMLEYRLLVKNNSTVPLTGIQFTDELSQYLEYVSQSGGLDFSRQERVLRWKGTLEEGQQVEIAVKARVGVEVFAGTRIANSASLTATELPKTVHSNTVETNVTAEPIPFSRVRFTKRSEVPQSEVGRVIRFSLTIENMSNSTLVSPLIEDYLPQGFSYVASSSLLNNQVFTEPHGSRRLEWQLPHIKPGETIMLRYQVVIGADAARGKNINRALLHTVDNSGQAINLEASSFINVSGDSFIFYSAVDGTVYLDRDDDGMYTMSDTPLKDIEVCMSTGQKSVTDTMGHYSFESLFPGEYALNVNRATLPEKYRLNAPAPRVVVLADGLSDTVDFGVKFSGDDPVKSARLEGRVFFDKNQDQVFDPGDALLEEFKAVLDNQVTTVGSKGTFVFTHLEPGVHMVEIVYEGRSVKKQVKLDKEFNHVDIALLFTGIRIIITSENEN
jgi:uncharacterized repeat protein (TIGR01451 family)